MQKLDVQGCMNSSKSSGVKYSTLFVQGATALLPFTSRYVNHAIYDLCKKLDLCLAEIKEASSKQVQPVMQPEIETTKMQRLRKGWPQQQQEVMQTIDRLHQDFIDAEKEICTQKLLHVQKVQACQQALAELRSGSF